ncbi:MAG: class I SAM-dependent methyltransferase [Bacteroidales bacterium]
MSQARNFILLLTIYLLVAISIGLFINSEFRNSVLIILTGLFISGAMLICIKILSQKNENRKKKILDDLVATYRQIESLFSIYSSLNIESILPPFRGWAISPDFATLILSKMKEKKPMNILECGSGISTVLIAYRIKKNNKGHLYSFEHDSEYAELTLQLLKRHGLEQYVTILNSPLIDHTINGNTWKWYDVNQIDKKITFDLVVVDGPPFQVQPKSRYPTLPLLDGYFNPDAVVLIDDCGREQDNEVIKDWLSEFNYYDSMWYDTEKGAFALTKHNG